MARRRGPSPRPRGSRPGPRRADDRHGSIPATAGEPTRPWRGTAGRWVHPRDRGGATTAPTPVLGHAGPSPRPRGSPLQHVGSNSRIRSIPATAGEPVMISSTKCAARVHPRDRGGADKSILDYLKKAGPSPRPRGSLLATALGLRAVGSIPATAGEPGGHAQRERMRRVHPRDRGGALGFSAGRNDLVGPSPRPRGSQVHDLASERAEGSIPATAGEPRGRSSAGATRWVHPRDRGGAHEVTEDAMVEEGPSPRPRGSRHRRRRRRCSSGSIPATAGEPVRSRSPRDTPRVHPRDRGGAGAAARGSRCWRGPSPRPRGSPLLFFDGIIAQGSIPATAGEPSWR